MHFFSLQLSVFFSLCEVEEPGFLCEDTTCGGSRNMAELPDQAAVSAVVQLPLLKGHPSVSFTLLKCADQIELNHLHSNWSAAVHSG